METPVSPKTKAAGLGGTLGGAVAVLAVSILGRNGIDLSDVEVGAITVLVTAGVSTVAAWWKRDPRRE